MDSCGNDHSRCLRQNQFCERSGGTYTFNDEDKIYTADRHFVASGSSVHFVAAPADGYVFAGWSLGRVVEGTDEMTIVPTGQIGTSEAEARFDADTDVVLCAVFKESTDLPPEIDASTIQLTFPEERRSDRILTAGDEIMVSAKITDADDVKSATSWLMHDGEDEEGSYTTGKRINMSKGENDIWTGTLVIPEDMDPGIWMFNSVVATDSKGDQTTLVNSAVLGEDELPFADLSDFDFKIKESHTVTFDTRGGTEIAQQMVIDGYKAAKPAAPTKEGRYFNMWYSDEGLTNIYWFAEPVTVDITLYAGWILQAGIGIYNQSNPDNNICGTIDITSNSRGYNYDEVTTMNYTLPEVSVTFKAKPAEGYTFKGWYEGIFGDSHYIETPSETLISDQNPYTPTSVDEAKALCAVFECTQHQWEQKIRKATPDTDGRIYQVCSICGTEETLAPLLKVSNITFEGTSYTYSGKPIEPKVTVANASESLSADNYTVAYSNNTKAGTATIKVTLKGDYYEGAKELTFRIAPLSVGSASVTGLTAKTYTRKPLTQSPVVKVGDATLRAGTDYTVSYRNNTNAGTATVVVTGKGNYTGTIEKTFTIDKAANTLTTSAKTASVKYSKLKKKAQKLAASKVIKFTGSGQGAIKYTLSSAKKGKKSFKKYFKINAITGKVTVKKGLKKGIYKVKVKVTAAGDENYLPSAVRTVTFKVKVK